jgi:hypothetical protein
VINTPAFRQVSLVVECESDDSCVVLFEPYGAEYVLNPQDAFRVDIEGGGDGDLTITYGPGVISIRPWPRGDFVRVRNRAGDDLPM